MQGLQEKDEDHVLQGSHRPRGDRMPQLLGEGLGLDRHRLQRTCLGRWDKTRPPLGPFPRPIRPTHHGVCGLPQIHQLFPHGLRLSPLLRLPAGQSLTLPRALLPTLPRRVAALIINITPYYHTIIRYVRPGATPLSLLHASLVGEGEHHLLLPEGLHLRLRWEAPQKCASRRVPQRRNLLGRSQGQSQTWNRHILVSQSGYLPGRVGE